MFKQKNIAIIPARGGSKGLPRKNILPLAGRPLIAYSIEEAQRSKLISRVIVSSDDEETLTIAREIGAEVIQRPPELSQDLTPTLPVLLHVLQNLYTSDYPSKVVTLQPTSPLRTATQINLAIEMLDENFESCIGVCVTEHSPYKMLRVKNDILSPLIEGTEYGVPRQLLPVTYRENGAMYVTWTRILLEQKSIWGQKARPFIMDTESSVDIDTTEDLKLAEFFLQERQKKYDYH